MSEALDDYLSDMERGDGVDIESCVKEAEKAGALHKQITQLKADLLTALDERNNYHNKYMDLKADIAKLRQTISGETQMLMDEITVLEKREVELKADLAKFGGHTADCNGGQRTHAVGFPCTCGWAEVENGAGY